MVQIRQTDGSNSEDAYENIGPRASDQAGDVLENHKTAEEEHHRVPSLPINSRKSGH